jgi:type III pantothenate kinase
VIEEEIFVLDVGNTHVKAGRFKNCQLIDAKRMSPSEFKDYDWKDKVLILANVSQPEILNFLQSKAKKIVEINTSFRAAFTSNYTSSDTLGIDRFCNVEAMAISNVEGNLLCVDAGTCLKFDFLDATHVYCGGSISPGIDLRFKSLYDYTARLPLIRKEFYERLIGDSTKEAILSGVMKGVEAEILQRISWYEEQFPDLTIFVTGGDACYFDFHQKSNIFADENLTLKGIFSIYSRYAN